MASESIAHEAYWLRAHSGSKNNCQLYFPFRIMFSTFTQDDVSLFLTLFSKQRPVCYFVVLLEKLNPTVSWNPRHIFYEFASKFPPKFGYRNNYNLIGSRLFFLCWCGCVFSTTCSCTRVTKPQCVTREQHSSFSHSELCNSLMYMLCQLLWFWGESSIFSF